MLEPNFTVPSRCTPEHLGDNPDPAWLVTAQALGRVKRGSFVAFGVADAAENGGAKEYDARVKLELILGAWLVWRRLRRYAAEGDYDRRATAFVRSVGGDADDFSRAGVGELRTALGTLGVQTTDAEARVFCDAHGGDDGRVDLDGFLRIATRRLGPGSPATNRWWRWRRRDVNELRDGDLRRMFREHDVDDARELDGLRASDALEDLAAVEGTASAHRAAQLFGVSGCDSAELVYDARLFVAVVKRLRRCRTARGARRLGTFVRPRLRRAGQPAPELGPPPDNLGRLDLMVRRNERRHAREQNDTLLHA